jgi:hypothetical protein
MRTASDFLNDMLSKGKDWITITSVARVVREGKWYDEVVDALQKRGLMPTDVDEINSARKKDAANPRRDPPKFFFAKKQKD